MGQAVRPAACQSGPSYVGLCRRDGLTREGGTPQPVRRLPAPGYEVRDLGVVLAAIGAVILAGAGLSCVLRDGNDGGLISGGDRQAAGERQGLAW